MPDFDRIAISKKWVSDWVIQLNLCPFAAKPFQEDAIRYVLFNPATDFEILDHFAHEIEYLKDKDTVSTTLLVFENEDLVRDFEDFLDIYYYLESKLEDFEWETDFQLAAFHPDYLFGGEHPESNSHYTNRAPFPIIHILRTEQVEAARNFYPDVEEIPQRNIERMLSLPVSEINQRLYDIKGAH